MEDIFARKRKIMSRTFLSKHCVLSYMFSMASISNISLFEKRTKPIVWYLLAILLHDRNAENQNKNGELRFMRSFFVIFNEWCATVVDWDRAVEGCRCNCRRRSKTRSDQINSDKYYVLWFRDDSACAFDDSESNQSRRNNQHTSKCWVHQQTDDSRIDSFHAGMPSSLLFYYKWCKVVVGSLDWLSIATICRLGRPNAGSHTLERWQMAKDRK